MARKNAENTEVVEAEVAEVETTEAESAPAEVEIDLTQFESALAEALEGADAATGTVPEVLVAKVRDAYQALPGAKGKSKAKQVLSEGMTSAIGAGNLAHAQAYVALQKDAAVPAKSGSSSAPKKVVDPAVAATEHLATLTLALFIAQANLPEGVDAEKVKADAQTQASDAFADALTQVEDVKEDASPIVRKAIKLATSKIRAGGGSNGSGVRRDLGAHIKAAFDAAESGQFLSVAEIRKFPSGVYGDDLPSAGAISNRLQPKSGSATTIEGITVEVREGKLGAVKN